MRFVSIRMDHWITIKAGQNAWQQMVDGVFQPNAFGFLSKFIQKRALGIVRLWFGVFTPSIGHQINVVYGRLNLLFVLYSVFSRIQVILRRFTYFYFLQNFVFAFQFLIKMIDFGIWIFSIKILLIPIFGIIIIYVSTLRWIPITLQTLCIWIRRYDIAFLYSYCLSFFFWYNPFQI